MYGAADYPQLLHSIPDAPPIITIMGHAHVWQKDCVALVGARNASANGCQFAQRLAKELGGAGLALVSGLARGIDSFVHKGSLASGTVAVIAGGIDNIYPPENEMLYRQIRESGVVISEQPFGSIPFAGSFPGRNRIIAGMSLGTVVVEASPKSGSLITARLAQEYHREVMAVPGSPLDPRSKGGNQLLKQGAVMVETMHDVLQAIQSTRGRVLEESAATPYISQTQGQPDGAELDKVRLILLEKLGASAVSVDELIEQCDTSAPVILTLLLELELAGRLKRSPGNKVYLSQIMEEVA
jgi:DNA processing protein